MTVQIIQAPERTPSLTVVPRAAAIATSVVVLIAACGVAVIALTFPHILEPGSDYEPCVRAWSGADFVQKALGVLAAASSIFSLRAARQGRRTAWAVAVTVAVLAAIAWIPVGSC